MKAFIIEGYGKGSVGRVADLPEPVVHEDDVLIQVHAAGVNALDAEIRNGEFKRILPYALPLMLGNDVPRRSLRVLKPGGRRARWW